MKPPAFQMSTITEKGKKRTVNRGSSICFCSGMGNVILKLFQIYYGTEQMSICVDAVGGQGSHCGSRNIKYEMGVWQERTVRMGWRYWYELVISKISCVCAYMCAYVKYVGAYIMCEYVYVHGCIVGILLF